MIGEIRQNFTEASASVGLILATALITKGYRVRATTIGGSNTVKRFCSNAVLLRMFNLTLSVKLNIRKNTALEQKRLIVSEQPIVVARTP